MPFRRIAVFVFFVVSFAATASADTVRVVVDRALVWTRPGGVSIVMNQLVRGQTAEVVRRVGDWYEIVAPPGSGGGDRSTGFISASQVVLESGSSPSGRSSQTRPAPRPARVRPPFARFFIVDVGYRAGLDDVTQSFTAFSDVLAEGGSIATNYGRNWGVTLDALYVEPIGRSFGIGVGFDYSLRNQHANVTARIPHPFFFNQLRPATFETDALTANQAALSVPVAWIPKATQKLRIVVFGGPTIFRVSQTVVTNVVLGEQYPFDTVRITGVRTTERTGMPIGYQVGGDVTHFFTPSAGVPRAPSPRAGRGHLTGVGVGVRYSHAKIKFNDDNGVTTAGNAGGLSVVAGLRFGF
jgi:hypothetical protein